MLRKQIAPETEPKCKQWANLALYARGVIDALDDEAQSLTSAIESLMELKAEIIFSRKLRDLPELERRRIIRELDKLLPDAVVAELPAALARCREAIERIDAIRVPDTL